MDNPQNSRKRPQSLSINPLPFPFPIPVRPNCFDADPPPAHSAARHSTKRSAWPRLQRTRRCAPADPRPSGGEAWPWSPSNWPCVSHRSGRLPTSNGAWDPKRENPSIQGRSVHESTPSASRICRVCPLSVERLSPRRALRRNLRGGSFQVLFC